jgi:hypothetical protein
MMGKMDYTSHSSVAKITVILTVPPKQSSGRINSAPELNFWISDTPVAMPYNPFAS